MAKIVVETGDLSSIIAELRALESMRRITLKQEMRSLQSILGNVRKGLGWKWDAEPEERKKMNARAKNLVMAVWKGKELPEGEDAEHLKNLRGIMLAFQTPYESWSVVTELIVKRAAGLAKRLPAWLWVEQHPGLSENTLARLVGVLGNPDDYRSWKLCCKKLGLAPYNGRLASAWRTKIHTPEKLTAEEWVALGYSPTNRSMIHMVGEAAIRNNTPGYREIYDAAKAKELAREDANKPQSPMHAHKRALVMVERRMVRNFWCAWRYGSHELPAAVAA